MQKILEVAMEMLSKKNLIKKIPKRRTNIDQPDESFEGPF